MAHKKIKVVTNEGNCSPQQSHIMYGKDSLDRFGDDLCQHLLSYLSLFERFRYSCLSKQWQRVIYETIDEITINDHLLYKTSETNIFGEKFTDYKCLQHIMRKCTNIEVINLQDLDEEDFEVIDQIRDKCLNVRHIHCYIEAGSDDLLRYLCQLFGPMITRIGCNENESGLRVCLNLCHNLSHLSVCGLDAVFDESTDQCLAKDLIQFRCSFGSQYVTNNMFSTFMANNKSLKSLKITFYDIIIESQETFNGLMNSLSQLQELRELKLHFSDDSKPIEYSLSEPLVEIGLKCHKLKKFCLSLESQTLQLNVQTFNSIQFMKHLKRLELSLELPKGVKTVTNYHLFNSLKCWPKLTHLSLKLWQINHKLFQEIGIHLPNLQILHIHESHGAVNAFCLDSIASLRKLQSLSIGNQIVIKLKESHLKAFVLKSSPKLKSINICYFKKKSHSNGVEFQYNDKQIYEMRNMLPLSD